MSADPTAGPRTWVGGDNEPSDSPRIVDAHGHTWWRAHDGWRSANIDYRDPSRTWWWLTMYCGPLREDLR